MVISASWISRSGDSSLNLRGVATVLSLAGFLKSKWRPRYFIDLMAMDLQIILTGPKTSYS